MFSHNLVVQHSPPILLQSKPRAMLVKVMSGYCTERPTSSKLEVKQVISGLAASILCLSQSNMAFAADLPHYNSVFPRANSTDSIPVLPLEKGNEGGGGKLMMMRGMTAKDFDPVRYSGRWFEVASLKRGFAGQGQEDCHCTQGIYTFDMNAPAIQVDTFCVHGGPDGYITGIRGRVQCLNEEDKEKDETDLERQEMIREKCYLRFPTLPFIPKEPYDVIATDYDNFCSALMLYKHRTPPLCHVLKVSALAAQGLCV
ncbi:unnamed protein product [Withania somnifera]